MPVITLDLDMGDFVSELVAKTPRDELLDLIKQIDREVSEYEFTEELRDYFVKEMDVEEEYEYEYEDE